MYLSTLFFQFGLIFFGLWGAASLSYQQFLTGEACPTIIVPVCYVIGLVFLILLLTFKLQNTLAKFVFSLVLGLGLLVSGFASLSQFWGWGSCPLTTEGIPMCYLALTLFSSLFLTRIAHFYFFK